MRYWWAMEHNNATQSNELTDGKCLGWRIATFAAENLVPHANNLTTITELWDAYQGWCGSRNEERVTLPSFEEEWKLIAAKAGIVRCQRGANVYYRDVALKLGKGG